MPTPTRFGTKVPSSGSLSTTKIPCLDYVSDVRTFAVDKLTEDGTLVSKYVGVGTWYEMCFVICFTVFWLLHFDD
jgi:hypothetical protein